MPQHRDLERFWAKVDKTEDCWIWTASRLTGGYGMFGVGKKIALAHRFSWEIAHGPIPAGMYVLHHCDNPPCVRPDHLSLGTQIDNMTDAVAKGRQSKGMHRPNSKLTDEQVISIRADQRVQRVIAAEYGISTAGISNIKSGKIWRHLL